MRSFLWLLYAVICFKQLYLVAKTVQSPEFQCTPRARIILKFLHWEMSEYYVTAITI